MNRVKNTNLLRLVLWSIIPIAIGVTFSGLAVRAFDNSQKETKVETIGSYEEEYPEQNENIVLNYFEKIKKVISSAGKRAGNIVTKVDFNNLLYPPQATYHLKDADLLPKVGANAYVIADVDTGEIILEKNADIVHPIASVTKLMTALVSIENIEQSDYAKVSAKAIGTLGESGQLSQGEKMKISDLLYPLLLVSSNDAAEVLAEYEGRDKFMSLMNEQAVSIGMTHTNYEDPSGLSPNNYSTAKDLFALTHYLFTKHKTVFDITTLDKYSLANRTWSNANHQFSSRDNYLGGKTGYTDKAKRTGISVFKTNFEDYGDRNIAIILLKTDNRTQDINNILDYLNDNVYLSYNKTTATENDITLGFVGDIMLDRGVKTSVYKNFGGNYSRIFDEAKRLENPDIMFANLEGPISDKGKNVGSKYSFRFEPDVTQAIKNSGIDIVSFANNHVGDWSTEAFLDTLGRLNENNILFTGAGEDYQKATTPVIIERNGVKIGFLGSSDVGPEWMKAGETTPGILLANDKNLTTIISEAKENVDFLIVSIHWGDEYQPHTTRQETLAHKIIDAGADIVVGHHPHVAQDVEEYKKGLIIYSLGNFIFDQYFSPETMSGLYAEVTIDKNGIKKHKETTFKINDKYQPVLDLVLEKDPKFASGACPVGNSESDYMMFNSNSENTVEDYVPEGLVEINGKVKTKEGRTVCLSEIAAENLKAMSDDAKEAGLELVVTSGFRSENVQQTLYTNSKERNGEMENESVAKPGHSEHQLGTTVDLTTPEVAEQSTSPAFDDTNLYKWMQEHAHEYGFVMSYPQGKNTGYIFEPWHWRFLGKKVATEIKESGLTIQEFLESL